jgi:four helix bundle protein
MEKLRTFRDLKVWQKAHSLTLSVYKASREFPGDEKFGLVAQLRRSCASIATNIVEGFKRQSKKDQAHFLNLAQSSLEETKYHLLLSSDLTYLESKKYQSLAEQADEVGRMLHGYRSSVLRREASAFSLALLLSSAFLVLSS